MQETLVDSLPGWQRGDWVELQRTVQGFPKGAIVEIVDMQPSKGAKIRDHESGREAWTQGTGSLRVVRRTVDWETGKPVQQVLKEGL